VAGLELCRQIKAQSGLAEAACALGRHSLERGDVDAAAALFEEAELLARSLSLALPGPLPSAYLALMGRRKPGEVVIEEGTPIATRAEAHHVLYRAGGERSHLELAVHLLERVSEHLQPPDDEAFWRRNPTARAVRSDVDRGRPSRS
jgi:hypothetical protein